MFNQYQLASIGTVTNQYESIILANTAEPVRPTITTEFIECHRRDEREMPLATRDYTLFPRRKNSQEVILTTCLEDKLCISGKTFLISTAFSTY
jgi:hypothetical protein